MLFGKERLAQGAEGFENEFLSLIWSYNTDSVFNDSLTTIHRVTLQAQSVNASKPDALSNDFGSSNSGMKRGNTYLPV